jgi:hypothetical protein
MHRTRKRSTGGALWVALMLSVTWLGDRSALAQPAQQPTRPGPRGSEPSKGRESTRSGEKSGTPTRIRGWVLSYTPTQSGDETMLGLLKILPEEKGMKVQTLNLVRSAELQIRMDDKKIDVDQLPELLFKNLYCSVDWIHATTESGKKSTKKVVKTLQFESIDIVGTIEELGDDYIIVRGTPPRGDWPEAGGGGHPGQTQPTTVARKVKAKKLRLKTMERISIFLNEQNKPGDASEFATGDKVELRCAYGKSLGILLAVKHPLDVVTQDPNESKATKGPVAPPPRPTRRKSGG